jgi:hypothetical protein
MEKKQHREFLLRRSSLIFMNIKFQVIDIPQLSS